MESLLEVTDMLGSRPRWLSPTLIGVATAASIGVLAFTLRTIRRETLELDDNTLTAKVMSELFSDPSIPKGDIDINSEYGVVVLRGVVRTPDAIKSIEKRVQSIAGVRDVRNLLHLPKTRAKAASGTRVPPQE
jgi:BON domain-containing protein